MDSAAEIQEQLNDVKAGIKKVMSGQEYKIDTGQSVRFMKRANLKELMMYKQSLESDLSMAELKESGGQRGRGIFR